MATISLVQVQSQRTSVFQLCQPRCDGYLRKTEAICTAWRPTDHSLPIIVRISNFTSYLETKRPKDRSYLKPFVSRVIRNSRHHCSLILLLTLSLKHTPFHHPPWACEETGTYSLNTCDIRWSSTSSTSKTESSRLGDIHTNYQHALSLSLQDRLLTEGGMGLTMLMSFPAAVWTAQRVK